MLLGYGLLEGLVSRFSHSTALLADAGHFCTDAIALIIALTTASLARHFSPHRHRLESIAALINSTGLLLMAGLIAWEAWHHLQVPPAEILSWPMVVTAVLGLLVNSVNVGVLRQGAPDNLNVRVIFLHVLADLASSLGVIIAAITISLFHWLWADGLIGLAVALFIGLSALPMIRQSWHQWHQPQLSLEALGFLEIGQTDLLSLVREEGAGERGHRRGESLKAKV
ncbi:cation transporter [Halomicronema hongdechloris C2206]|uniref:Cation transporter n=2 Tax=Halomicronema hongdechloris TaxID=1209493 RepID=A0A1Z3HU88_9CYAN|nr:cation transporter [Halomicronema hongdechloris C2206]